ncbi:MAG: sugar phosphate nucleotidyltransferase [Candidatus Nealsonbacteria bacterium]
MQAIILAAGESSRFWPLNKVHKSQISFFGKPLIYWTIRSLSDKGIKDIIIVVNASSFLSKDFSSVAQELGITLSFVVQDKPLGAAEAIYRAKDIIKGPFFVVWPYKINVGEIVEKIMEKQKDGEFQPALVCNSTANPENFGILKYEGEKVTEICRNSKKGEEPSNIKISGTYFLNLDFFNYYQSLSKHHPEDFIDVLNLYLKDREIIFLLWKENLPSLKYPWDLLSFSKAMFSSNNFNNSISASAVIGKNVVIGEKVYIGENVIIGDNTVISDSCFIGDNCKIGSNNVLRGPIVLEKGVIVGVFTEIKNCIIQEGTHFHSGYFGDSVIGKNCRFGAGFTVANRRIDRGNIKSIVKDKKIDTGLTSFGMIVGDDSKFGIQAGTMPGVLIGSDCLVGPGTLVFENLEDKTTFYTEFKNHKEINK